MTLTAEDRLSTRPRAYTATSDLPWLLDSLFLTVIVALSTIIYVGRLGFYSDDWAFLGALVTAPDQSLSGLVRAQLDAVHLLQMRPTQVVYQAALYRFFGLDPLGYHLVNAVVLVAVTVVLYWVLRELRLPRMLAVAVPAVYALLPNYSTNRFWFASFGYLLSMALYLISLFADLRGVSGSRAGVWRWKILGLASFSAAALGYEVILPLFVMTLVLSELLCRHVHGSGLSTHLGRPRMVAFHGSTLAVVALVVLYKAAVAEGTGIGPSVLRYALRLAGGIATANLGTYGIGLPHTVAWSAPYAGLGGVTVALVVGAMIYFYLGHLWDGPYTGRPLMTPRSWVRLAAAGFVVIGLGYAIFFTTGRISFTSTGIGNRVAGAGALGSALVLVAALGWLGARLPPGASDRLFRGGVAAVCACGIAINAGLASFWVESRQAQAQILTDIRTDLSPLPPGSTVLLHGVCPYIGPAIVFESSWDLRGALQVMHGDRSLQADVTNGIVVAEERGITTRIYHIEVHHPYGERLFLYDHRTGNTTVLTDEATAREALLWPERDNCATGRAGAGALVLPFDVLFGWFESRLYR